MSPSETISAGKIAKLTDLVAAALRKSGLPNAPTQQIIEKYGLALAEGFVNLIRERVEAISDPIRDQPARRVVVDRLRGPKDTLIATGRSLRVDDYALRTMPRGAGKHTEVVFFKIGRDISNDDVARKYEQHGLVPADPYSLAAVNKADPAFADIYPNTTRWRNPDRSKGAGKWCGITFGHISGERYVAVGNSDYEDNHCWWFAGLRK